jgi:hypothetical protein
MTSCAQGLEEERALELLPATVDWVAEERRLCEDLQALASQSQEESIYHIAYDQGCQESTDGPKRDDLHNPDHPSPDLPPIDWEAEEQQLYRDLEARMGDDEKDDNIYRRALRRSWRNPATERQVGVKDESTRNPHP